jgi:serine/threonine protein phosphatase PrpC
VRSRNEDAFLCRPELGLFVVADGMGGLVAGDRASRAVTQALAALQPAPSLAALDRAVERVLEQVHERLLADSVSFGPSGTTAVVLLVDQQSFRVLWCGDSRAGRLRHGQLEWLTTDHNLAAELVRRGRMSDEEARRHPLSSRLIHALGCGSELHIDRIAGRVLPGDLLLLCSDGLTGELSDAEIANILTDSELERAADRLLAAALDRGGHDNVTFVLVPR